MRSERYFCVRLLRNDEFVKCEACKLGYTYRTYGLTSRLFVRSKENVLTRKSTFPNRLWHLTSSVWPAIRKIADARQKCTFQLSRSRPAGHSLPASFRSFYLDAIIVANVLPRSLPRSCHIGTNTDRQRAHFPTKTDGRTRQANI